MVRQVNVHWDDPIEFKDIFLKKNKKGEFRDNLRDTYALYMITEDIDDGKGRQLIYIGIVKSDQRDLYTRMNEHRKKWLGRVAKYQIEVKFGALDTRSTTDEQLIEDVESALVFGSQPRENTTKKNSYQLYKDVEVKNFNHGGFLKRSYSTKYQIDESWPHRGYKE